MTRRIATIATLLALLALPAMAAAGAELATPPTLNAPVGNAWTNGNPSLAWTIPDDGTGTSSWGVSIADSNGATFCEVCQRVGWDWQVDPAARSARPPERLYAGTWYWRARSQRTRADMSIDYSDSAAGVFRVRPVVTDMRGFTRNYLVRVKFGVSAMTNSKTITVKGRAWVRGGRRIWRSSKTLSATPFQRRRAVISWWHWGDLPEGKPIVIQISIHAGRSVRWIRWYGTVSSRSSRRESGEGGEEFLRRTSPLPPQMIQL